LPLILIVDPDPDSRVILSLLLAHAGFDIALADDGPAGYAATRTLLPAAIVGEHPILLEDGASLCERLRADPVTASIPFVALTSRATSRELAHAGHRHCLVLTKPLDLSAVIEAVRAVVAASGATRV
jgi:CheY-like chemotaxis protein